MHRLFQRASSRSLALTRSSIFQHQGRAALPPMMPVQQFQAMQYASKLTGNEYRMALKQQQPFIDQIKQAQATADADKALNVVRGMVKQGMTPLNDLYQMVVDTCISSNKFDAAMDVVFKDMRDADVEPQISTFHSLISACKLQKNTALASDLFKQMIDFVFTPEIETLNCLLEVFVAAGDPRVYDMYTQLYRFSFVDDRTPLIIEEAKKTIPIPPTSFYHHFDHLTRNRRGVNVAIEAFEQHPAFARAGQV